MPKVILPPLLALAGGFGGFLLRRWELSAAFDASGLAIPWAPSSLLLILWSLLIAGAILLLCRKPLHAPKGYDDGFAAVGNLYYLVLSAVAAVCLLLAGVLGLGGEFTGGAPGLLRMLLWVLCLVSCICVVSTVLANFRGAQRSFNLILLAPAYTFCVWLVVAYQQRAADPVVQDYMYELFAIICALLAFYFTAGFSFGKAKVWPCAVFCLLSVYFGVVTLADGHETAQRLLVLFSVFYQLAAAAVLLNNTFAVRPKRLLRAERMPERAEDDAEETGAGDDAPAE